MKTTTVLALVAAMACATFFAVQAQEAAAGKFPVVAVGNGFLDLIIVCYTQ